MSRADVIVTITRLTFQSNFMTPQTFRAGLQNPFGILPYDAFNGPNSKTAADNIIEKAGGMALKVPGAWQPGRERDCESIRF